MATLSSAGSLCSFDLALSLRSEQEAAPNWSVCTWGRNTYCRFLPLNTLEAVHTFTHMNLLAASTFCARGTQCALEYRPITRLTFS